MTLTLTLTQPQPPLAPGVAWCEGDQDTNQLTADTCSVVSAPLSACLVKAFYFEGSTLHTAGDDSPQTLIAEGDDSPQTLIAGGDDSPQTLIAVSDDSPQTLNTGGDDSPQTLNTVGDDGPNTQTRPLIMCAPEHN